MGCGRPKHADCRLCVPVECVAAPALTRIRACDHLPNMAKPGCSAHFTERRVGARYAKLDAVTSGSDSKRINRPSQRPWRDLSKRLPIYRTALTTRGS